MRVDQCARGDPPPRTLVAWCPDWPLVAAGMADRPAAVLKSDRVVASTASARAEGVSVRQRRREAEAACPGLTIAEENPARDVRAFETVASAIGRFSPLVEVTRPGVCSLPARGPARYFGGEESLAAAIAGAASEAVAGIGGPSAPPCRVGIADTPFAAKLAAHAAAGAVLVVAPGMAATAEWLAPFPLGVLGVGEIADLLGRLGIHRLGQLAAMDEGLVSARFGSEGARAHRLARGLDDHRLALSEPPADLCVQRELDDPVERVETLAFIAAGLAEELMVRLASRGWACTRLLVEASTEHAEELSRWWRADRPFTAKAMVDRVRWQLEGWIASGTSSRGSSLADGPSVGIALVRLTAGEVVFASGRQLGLPEMTGLPGSSLGVAERTERVERAVARVQGLLGHEAVAVPSLVGGRSPGERVTLVPYGEPRDLRPPEPGPWPGRLPLPAPAIVHAAPITVTLRDAAGVPVEVSGRGRLSGVPCGVFIGPGEARSVVAWAGPWPYDERWWDPTLHRRRARMQVLLDDGSAHVLVLERGRWAIEATYD